MCDHFDFGWVHCFFGPQGVEEDHGKSSKKTGSVDLIIPGTGWFDVENMWFLPLLWPALEALNVGQQKFDAVRPAPLRPRQTRSVARRANRAPFFGTLLNLIKVPHGSTQTRFLTSINTILPSLPYIQFHLQTRRQHVRKQNC